MKSFVISKRDAGTRVDRFIDKTFENLPKSLMYKEIRKKNIKVNKKRCTNDQKLKEGDLLELYLKDDVLKLKVKHLDFMSASDELDIVYEDENIIILNKKVGILCHPDGKEYIDNLVARLKKYLYQKGEWSPETSSFTPSLANRIDRNTGGLVIGAKNLQSLKILNAKIKSREIEKFYLTVVHGKMPKSEEVLTAFLTKNEKKNLVKVTDNQVEGSKKIITKYKVLDYYDDASLLEIELLTGRTHQIRAHLAHIGHPLYGDGKYGIEEGRFRQALYSYKLKFAFDDENGANEYLPHNYASENCIVYGGTHDNDTIVGYYKEKSDEEIKFVKQYLGISKKEDLPRAMIRCGYASIAKTAVFQMQDILALDNSARMNCPSTVGTNWKWRMLPNQFTTDHIRFLKKMCRLYNR